MIDSQKNVKLFVWCQHLKQKKIGNKNINRKNVSKNILWTHKPATVSNQSSWLDTALKTRKCGGSNCKRMVNLNIHATHTLFQQFSMFISIVNWAVIILYMETTSLRGAKQMILELTNLTVYYFGIPRY